MRLKRSALVVNIVSLYGVQMATLLIPLATLPYLARVLRPESWGHLASVQALGLMLSLIVEFGFGYSATRQVARYREDPQALSRIAAEVLSAKLFLLVLLVAVAALIYFFFPSYQVDTRLYLWAIAFGMVQGFTPLWYFQGRESLARPAALDVVGRLLGAVGIFALVRAPEDAWLVLALQTLATGMVQLINTLRLYREVHFLAPTAGGVVMGLREGCSMFVFRVSVGLYTTANSALLRLYLPGTQVAYYANAERLSGAAKGVLHPFTQALFPRMAHLVTADPPAARRLLKRSLLFLFPATGLLALLLALAAPWIVALLFGPGYEASVGILRVLCLTLPVVSLSSVLGVQWLLPHGHDRAFNLILILAGLLNVALVVYTVPRFGSYGMAWSVVIVESLVTSAMALYAFGTRSNRMAGSNHDPTSETL